jgi:prolyl-tRNA synthetase
MRLSQLITKTKKDVSAEDPSRNAQLLTQAGFVNRLMAGVYSYLPLGLKTLSNIENIIREEMCRIGAQEILMPALQPKDIWEKTERWNKLDVLFKLKGAGDRDLALGPTHEEVVTPLVCSYIRSYRDLPQTSDESVSLAVFQIQTKFRNEARAKSGLLRGREFRMKDMYSFHSSQEDLDAFYERATEAYRAVFRRCGLGDQTVLTYASGGAFSKFSHEFQTLTPYGEDTVYRVSNEIALNKEILDEESVRTEFIKDRSIEELEEVKAIEVGNIFKLGTKFPDAFSALFTTPEGENKKIYMGCYGIGPSRVMGTIAECLSDDKGLVWPIEVAPFKVHLTSLARTDEEITKIDEIYDTLNTVGITVLYDDRHKIQGGGKLNDADLLGMPIRIVASAKTLEKDSVEVKFRTSDETQLVRISELIQFLKNILSSKELKFLKLAS